MDRQSDCDLVSPAVAADRRGGVRTSSRLGGDLALVLNDTLDAIEDGRLEIERHLKPLALSPMVTNRLEVIFEELVSNVIRYGLQPGGGESILVTVGADADRIRLAIEDDGLPFDPFNLAEPPSPKSLEEARIGGLGIPVVRRLASSTSYERNPRDAVWRQLIGGASRPVNRVVVTL